MTLFDYYNFVTNKIKQKLYGAYYQYLADTAGHYLLMSLEKGYKISNKSDGFVLFCMNKVTNMQFIGFT